MDTFKDKVVVVTGAASGIGLAVVQAFAAEGAKVVLADIEQGALDAAVQGLKASGANAEGLVTDVGDRDAMERLAEFTEARFGAPQVVMLNAGVVAYGRVQDVTMKDWSWITRVNLWGCINGVDAFLPRLLATGEEGHIVLTASFAGLVPNRGLATYNVTKAGVVALAESLHQDLYSTPINASVLCPMFVTSKLSESARNRPDEFGGPAAGNPQPTDRDDSRTLSGDVAAQIVLDGIRNKRLYLQTHKEAEKYVRNRADKILKSFDYAV